MSMLRRDDVDGLLNLIDEVYDAALDEGRWAAIAPGIAKAFGSTSTNLQIQRVGDSSRILSMTENVKSRFEEYRDHYWHTDIWVERAIARVGVSKVGSSADMVTDREFEETEFYRDWCRHLDVFYVVGAVFPTGRGELGVLGVHRPRASGTYESHEKYLVSRFLPHLQRALRVRDHLAQSEVQRQISELALDRSETATLLLSSDSRIIYSNPKAEELLMDGRAIRSKNGRLTAAGRLESEQLSALIREASMRSNLGPQLDGILSLRRMGQQPLSLLVAPFRLRWGGQGAPAAIVFIRDPGRVITAVAAIRALFHLTPTEAVIAEALANGKTIVEIAAMQRASQQTVRKQVKSILAKTGTRRQTDCVAVILRSIAAIARH
jgi:DNA-binding CsgD family transcriptional regulator